MDMDSLPGPSRLGKPSIGTGNTDLFLVGRELICATLALEALGCEWPWHRPMCDRQVVNLPARLNLSSHPFSMFGLLSELCSDTISAYPSPILISMFLPFILRILVVHFQYSLLWTILLCSYLGPDPDSHSDLDFYVLLVMWLSSRYIFRIYRTFSTLVILNFYSLYAMLYAYSLRFQTTHMAIFFI
jgi:hypothetical protein